MSDYDTRRTMLLGSLTRDGNSLARANGLLDAFLEADRSRSIGSQTATLEKGIRHLGGKWTAGRAVTLLYGAGYTVTEKRARQILRDLAAAGLLEKTGLATYRTNEK